MAAIPNLETGHDIDAEDLDGVSIDQLQSQEPDHISLAKEKPSTLYYHTATLFVDHASWYLFLGLNCSTCGTEAVASKCAFERIATDNDVTIKHYRGGNGIFFFQAWKTACEALQQSTSFCGLNTHHHNGIAERHIRWIVVGYSIA